MSKNKLRFQKVETNREYRILYLTKLYPPWDDSDHSWINKKFPNHKGRSYKTWKHTRKTQYK